MKASQTPEPTVLTTLLSFLSQGEGEAMETWFLLPRSVPSLSLPGHHWAEVTRSQDEKGAGVGKAGRTVPPFATSSITLILENLKEKTSLELGLCWVES